MPYFKRHPLFKSINNRLSIMHCSIVLRRFNIDKLSSSTQLVCKSRQSPVDLKRDLIWKKKKMWWSTASVTQRVNLCHPSSHISPAYLLQGDKCITNLRLGAIVRWNNQISQTLTQKPLALWCQSDVWRNDDTVTAEERKYEESDGWMVGWRGLCWREGRWGW